MPHLHVYELRREKTFFMHIYVKTKMQISCAVTMQLISPFGFTEYTIHVVGTIPQVPRPKFLLGNLENGFENVSHV